MGLLELRRSFIALHLESLAWCDALGIVALLSRYQEIDSRTDSSLTHPANNVISDRFEAQQRSRLFVHGAIDI